MRGFLSLALKIRGLVLACIDTFVSAVVLGFASEKSLENLVEDGTTGSHWYLENDYITQGLFGWEERCISSLPPGSRVHVMAAGSGREMLALFKGGFLVEGSECNALLREEGNKVLEQHRCPPIQPASRNEVPIMAGVQGVILGWGLWSCLVNKRVRRTFLQGLRENLPSGTPVIFSFLAYPRPNLRFRLANQMATVFRLLCFRRGPAMGDWIHNGFVHYFTREDFVSELEGEGFVVLGYDETSYGHATAKTP